VAEFAARVILFHAWRMLVRHFADPSGVGHSGVEQGIECYQPVLVVDLNHIASYI
jgi:hypothetical protein